MRPRGRLGRGGPVECARRYGDKMVVEIGQKIPVVETDAHVIMPNHVHGIIRLVGADPCVRPDVGTRMGTLHAQGTRTGVPLPRIVQWFKTMTTSQYLNIARNLTPAPLSGRLWQRNYYEHIIRNEKELYAISEYITANPFNRREDPDNPDAGANPRLDHDP